MRPLRVLAPTLFVALALPITALAYVGPGVGAGAVGAMMRALIVPIFLLGTLALLSLFTVRSWIRKRGFLSAFTPTLTILWGVWLLAVGAILWGLFGDPYLQAQIAAGGPGELGKFEAARTLFAATGALGLALVVIGFTRGSR